MNRVLVVDDSDFMIALISDILVSEGFEVVAKANNGKEAIYKYKKTNPDLVVTDITMPKLNGLKMIEKIIKFDPGASIVVISAMNQRPTVLKSIELGAIDFIAKPFEESKVKEVVKKATEKAKS